MGKAKREALGEVHIVHSQTHLSLFTEAASCGYGGLGLGRMLVGTSAKEANNSVRGLRRYNEPKGTEPEAPSEQVQPSVYASPARSAASPRQALGSSMFLVFIGLLVVL